MDGVHAVLHAVSVKVEQLAVAALVVSVGCARAPAPAAQTVAAPAAPAGDAPSEVAPAIDRFDVEMADARVVRGRLIATESACDKYCWARVQVEEVVSAQEGDALGEIRVAFRSGGPGVLPGSSTLYLAPYRADYQSSKLWRLVTDRERPSPPTASQVAASWAHAFRKGDEAWLEESTAMPFSFRRVDVSTPPKPDDVSAGPACPTQLTSPAGLAPWLDCLFHGSADDTLAWAIGFTRPKTTAGVAAAPARLLRAAQSLGNAGEWVHVVGEGEGTRYDLLVALTGGPGTPRVSAGLLELTLTAHGRRERDRRLNHEAFKRAIAQNDVAAVRRLLRSGASFDEVGNEFAPGDPPVTMAADQGRLEIVDVLLRAGANPYACCCGCVMALHRAIQKQHVAVVARLLQSMPDRARLREGYRPPLDLAREVGNREIIRLLEDRAKAP